MKAVHFGAGNIGRGFVGLLLHEGGYDLVFSDVSAALVEAINSASSYTVHEVGDGGVDKQVTNFRAIDSSVDAEALVDEIATALLPIFSASDQSGINTQILDSRTQIRTSFPLLPLRTPAAPACGPSQLTCQGRSAASLK